MVRRKGIILAGGNGSRLYPNTKATSKQLIPVYDKPMIYYPLSTLMLAGIKDILIITTPHDNKSFRELLGNGSQFGINIKYKIQSKPDGIAQAFLISEDFIGNSCVTLILGDNLFHGDFLVNRLKKNFILNEGASIFAYSVIDPERYGVVEFDSKGIACNIEEKPKNPKSKFAITGLYFYDSSVCKRAKQLEPSDRGELEITDLNNSYIKDNKLKVKLIRDSAAWFDTGNPDQMFEAAMFVKSIQSRTGQMIGNLEDAAFKKGLIDQKQFYKLVDQMPECKYKTYLLITIFCYR